MDVRDTPFRAYVDSKVDERDSINRWRFIPAILS